MKEQWREDLERVERLAFSKVSNCKEFVQRFHVVPATAKRDANYQLLEKIYGWVFVPLSLWPEDLRGFGLHVMECIEGGRKVDAATRLMARLLPEAPSDVVCGPIAAYEHAVKAGNYEGLIEAQSKFDSLERELRENPELQADWAEIRALFDVSKYQNAAGVIRRRLVQERNFRPADWKFSWETEAQRFQNVFDAFCHKWDLYGMERRQTSTLKPQASGKVQNSDPKSSPSNEMAKGRGQSDRKSLLSPRGREGESSGTWVPLLL